jgi:hypothetical protein
MEPESFTNYAAKQLFNFGLKGASHIAKDPIGAYEKVQPILPESVTKHTDPYYEKLKPKKKSIYDQNSYTWHNNRPGGHQGSSGGSSGTGYGGGGISNKKMNKHGKRRKLKGYIKGIDNVNEIGKKFKKSKKSKKSKTKYKYKYKKK